MKSRNPKLYRACGQHINASDDKCTDLKRHPFTMAEYEAMQIRAVEKQLNQAIAKLEGK